MPSVSVPSGAVLMVINYTYLYLVFFGQGPASPLRRPAVRYILGSSHLNFWWIIPLL